MRYFLKCSLLEKIWKNVRFYGRLWPDWGNTARAAMARLGSIGIKVIRRSQEFVVDICCIFLD